MCIGEARLLRYSIQGEGVLKSAWRTGFLYDEKIQAKISKIKGNYSDTLVKFLWFLKKLIKDYSYYYVN